MDRDSELELVARVRAGDAAALERAIVLGFGMVYLSAIVLTALEMAGTR